MKLHKKLHIWGKVIGLIKDVYGLVSKFPREEVFGLTSQMKRAGVSIASNIAEGCARSGSQEKIRFFTISRGSVSELDAQMEIALSLGYIVPKEYSAIDEKIQEISRMLQGLINSVKDKQLTNR
ncbi:MAG: four helix bundle protein [Elusimicrobiota bacterium]